MSDDESKSEICVFFQKLSISNQRQKVSRSVHCKSHFRMKDPFYRTRRQEGPEIVEYDANIEVEMQHKIDAQSILVSPKKSEDTSFFPLLVILSYTRTHARTLARTHAHTHTSTPAIQVNPAACTW